MKQWDIIFTKQHEFVVMAANEEEALSKAAKALEKELDETGPYTYDVEIYTLDTSKLS